MALVEAFAGHEILFKFDPTGGNTLASNCAINSTRGIQFDIDTTTSALPDCDNPQDPRWRDVRVTSRGVTVSGAGIAHKPSLLALSQMALDGQVVNGIMEVGGAGGVSYAGKFVATGFDLNGDDQENAEFSITFTSKGEVVVAAIPAA